MMMLGHACGSSEIRHICAGTDLLCSLALACLAGTSVHSELRCRSAAARSHCIGSIPCLLRPTACSAHFCWVSCEGLAVGEETRPQQQFTHSVGSGVIGLGSRWTAATSLATS